MWSIECVDNANQELSFCFLAWPKPTWTWPDVGLGVVYFSILTALVFAFVFPLGLKWWKGGQ